MDIFDLLQGDGYIDVPLKTTTSGHIEVDAQVNGEYALLILDTGAGRTVFDTAIAGRLHLQLKRSKAKAAGLGSVDHGVQTSIVDEMDLGSLTITKLKVVMMDLSHVNQARAQVGSAACDGVIGADILTGWAGVIDYGSRRLYLKKDT